MIFGLNVTSQSVTIQIVDDVGLPVTGLVAATFPTLVYNRAGANADVAFPALSDLATITTAWAAGGVKERTGGYYRLDVPDAIFTAAGQVRVRGEATNKRVLCTPLDVAVTVNTLANLPAIPGGWLTAAGIAAGALNGKGDWSTYAGADTAGTTTLLARLTAGRATNLDNLDAAISTRLASSGYAAPQTATEVADAVLSRDVSNVEGTAPEHSLCYVVLSASEASVTGTTLAVKRTDGVTPFATKTLTVSAGASPVTGVA